MKHTLIVTLIAASLLISPGNAVIAQSGCAARHTVQFGENLFRIGLKYGLAWTAIQSANGLANPDKIFIGQVLCIPAVLPPVAFPTAIQTPLGATPTRTSPPPASTPAVTATLFPTIVFPIPTIRIASVLRDQSVTITAINFPANTSFEVLMGPYGTQGVGGTQAGTQASGTGAFTATYTIPVNLRGADKIAIRLQSASGYYSFNWFYN